MDGKLIEVNDTRLYCEVAGPHDAAAVVLVHGFSLDTRMWDGQWDALAASYRVVRYDLRGFGRSDAPNVGEPYQHSADLIALLDRLELEGAAVVGLSLGGSVVLETAICYPERVSALILVGAVVPGIDVSDLDMITGPVWKAGRTEGVEAARARWIDCPLFEEVNRRPASREAFRTIVADYSGWSWTNRDPGTSAISDCTTELGRIAVPTLVVVGERDIAGMRKTAETLADGIPDARLVVLSELGHMPNMEDAAAFNAALLDFLAATLT